MQVLGVALERLDAQAVGIRVGADHGAEAQVGAPQRLTQRHDDVARLERPARRAGQQRREQEEVRVVDERDPRAVGWELALERARGVEAAEAPARDDDMPGHQPTLPMSSSTARAAR